MKKNFKLFAVLFFTILSATQTLAQRSLASEVTPSAEEVSFDWNSVKDLVADCAVQPVAKLANGRTKYLRVVSLCPESLSVTGNLAQFNLNGARYSAVLLDSPLADEGDLNTLVVRDSEGKIAAKAEHIPAFGDILLALAGSQDAFRQILVEPRDR